MGVRRKYRPNIYFAPGHGLPELPSDELVPHFKHMGPVAFAVQVHVRVRFAVETLGRFEELYPRSGHNSRGEIIERANHLLWQWSVHQPVKAPGHHVLADLLEDVLEELESAITHLTPLYTMYGAYPPEPGFQGVWPDEQQIEESVESGELVRLYFYHGVAHPSDETAIADAMSGTASNWDVDPDWSGHVLAVRVAGSKPKYQKLYWIFKRSVNRLIWKYIEP